MEIVKAWPKSANFALELKECPELPTEKLVGEMGSSFQRVNSWENGQTPSQMAKKFIEQHFPKMGADSQELWEQYFCENLRKSHARK